jgi:hypothetical protein
MLPIGTDHHARLFFGHGMIPAVAAYTGYASIIQDQFFGSETFANFRAGFGGCIDEDLIEHRPPHAVLNLNAIYRWCATLKHELSHIERNFADCRTIRLRNCIK